MIITIEDCVMGFQKSIASKRIGCCTPIVNNQLVKVFWNSYEKICRYFTKWDTVEYVNNIP